jgi:hypothetical protein
MGELDARDAEPNVPERVELDSAIFEKLQEEATPAVLYHYTDQAGLLGIIGTGELWATKVQYMNDATEFTRVVELASKEIQRRIDNAKGIRDFELELLTFQLKNIHRITNINIFCVSFCRDPDLLSQWRGYSGQGSGYAIGFSAPGLLELTHRNSCRLGRCIYDEGAQVEIIRDLIDQAVHQADRLYRTSEDYTSYMINFTLASALENALIKLGSFFKDAAFVEENEWRLVTDVRFYGEEVLGFRTGKSMPIPYYRLNIRNVSWKNKIVQVTIGPCPHPELTRDAVIGLLVGNSVTTDDWSPDVPRTRPQVSLSRIPYRSW